jgi:hypothetical protein
MPDNSYTVLEDHVILFPARPDEIDITERGEECEWCVKTYPDCGSDSPHSFCPIIDLPRDFIFVTRSDKGEAIG